MTLPQATTSGAVIGAALGFAVCIIKDISMIDMLFRISILTIGGGWIGFLLAWLNMILPQSNPHHKHHSEHL